MVTRWEGGGSAQVVLTGLGFQIFFAEDWGNITADGRFSGGGTMRIR